MQTVNSNCSYYEASANTKKSYPSLEAKVEADVCIIGGGFTGLSAALHLAEKSYSVILLEAKTIGWGASGRNGGQVCQGHNKDHAELVSLVGKQAADNLWDMSLDAVNLVKNLIAKHSIACDLKTGVLHAATKPAHSDEIKQNVEYCNEQLAYSALHYLDSTRVADMLGTDRFYAAELWSDAAHLHPLNYALGLADAADKAGVIFYENSPVLRYSSKNPTEVSTPNGRVNTKYILLACNGYLEKLEPRIAGKIMPMNNFILATEPLDEATTNRINPNDVAVADSLFVINYFKLSADNRLLWGGGENYTSRFPKNIGQFVRKYMLQYYPELADTRIDYGWGGRLAITLNRMPCFARLDNNLFSAQGYSGHGVALATMGGKIIADAISGSAEKFDLLAQVPTPSFPGGTLLRWPGLVAGMLYYAMKDRFL